MILNIWRTREQLILGVVDSQATISSPYMRLQILWSDSFAEFDQILHLQNLDQREEHCKTPQIPKPLSVPLI